MQCQPLFLRPLPIDPENRTSRVLFFAPILTLNCLRTPRTSSFKTEDSESDRSTTAIHLAALDGVFEHEFCPLWMLTWVRLVEHPWWDPPTCRS